MDNIITLENRRIVEKKTVKSKKNRIWDKVAGNASYFLIAAMFTVGSLLALVLGIPVKSIMSGYSYDVLVILIVMELFTNLIAETGIMQLLAIKIAELSKGKKRTCLMMFGGMMFLISSCLNNITAVMMILPVVFVLLKALEVDRKYVYMFFAVILEFNYTEYSLHQNEGITIQDSDLPKYLKANWIDRQAFYNIRNYNARNDDVYRRALILLTFYSYYADAYCKTQSEMERGASDFREYADDFETELESVLAECGYIQLYRRNPYDWMFLYCAASMEPLSTFRDIIYKYFLEPTDTGDYSKDIQNPVL